MGSQKQTRKDLLYLASRSPRRKELLAQAGLRFRVYVPKAEELTAPGTVERSSPGQIVRAIAQAKAEAAYRELREKGISQATLLSADTLVFLDGRVLGKPTSPADARRMLKMLSGRTHTVCTAVTCLSFSAEKIRRKTLHVSTRVKFFPLQAEWIRWYVATGEPLDKAGSYGAQGHGAALVEKFSGSYTNVVGLPLGETLALLEEVSGKKRGFWLEKK